LWAFGKKVLFSENFFVIFYVHFFELFIFRLHKYCEKFLAWLKEPPIEQPGALLILNFCAIEIIAIIVGGAYLGFLQIKKI
jgi:hypothetical protein